MKKFVVHINYKVPFEEVVKFVQSHREFLQLGYDDGQILMSGPRNPKDGGIVICKSESLETLENFFNNDPYKLNNIADYKFFEFEPVKHQPFLKDWID